MMDARSMNVFCCPFSVCLSIRSLHCIFILFYSTLFYSTLFYTIRYAESSGVECVCVYVCECVSVCVYAYMGAREGRQVQVSE